MNRQAVEYAEKAKAHTKAVGRAVVITKSDGEAWRAWQEYFYQNGMQWSAREMLESAASWTVPAYLPTDFEPTFDARRHGAPRYPWSEAYAFGFVLGEVRKGSQVPLRAANEGWLGVLVGFVRKRHRIPQLLAGEVDALRKQSKAFEAALFTANDPSMAWLPRLRKLGGDIAERAAIWEERVKRRDDPINDAERGGWKVATGDAVAPGEPPQLPAPKAEAESGDGQDNWLSIGEAAERAIRKLAKGIAASRNGNEES